MPDPSSAGVHVTLDTLAVLVGQHLMAKKAALSPLQSATQASSGAQTNPCGRPRSRALHFCAKGMSGKGGRGPKEKIFHREMVLLRGQEQHRFVYSLGETWRLQELQ